MIGVAICQPMRIASTSGLGYGDADTIEQDSEQIGRDIAEAETEFRSALARHDAVLEWRSAVIYAPIADHVAHLARGADIILLGAAQGDWEPGSRCADPGDLIIQAGRPVMMIPQAVSRSAMDRVMIGWKDTPEARRAAHDALPILKKAKDVGVVAIAAEADMKASRAQLDDVARWLKQHGILAETSATTSNGEDSARLGGLAADWGADLIVAGAYGHSRLREWTFGGVTRDLLQHTGRCSLLSH